MMILPQLADSYGRKIVFNMAVFVSIGAQVGLILSMSLNKSSVFMFFLGICFPGKSVVIPEKKQTKYVSMGMISECLLLLCISIGYQIISRHWMWMQLIGLAATTVAFVF
jgi:hypothetical protein